MEDNDNQELRTVRVPKNIVPLFKEAENLVGKYFDNLNIDASSAQIDINGDRYVLIRAGALSLEFLESIQRFYADRGELQASIIGRNMLFDLAHLIGMDDAKNFHEKLDLKDPIAKLSAGPIHFAHTGWAFVDIHENSNPTPDENYFLSYDHPHSFEADAWIKAGKQAEFPVCIMNSGYSSGWCEESFGMSLTAVEVTCRAKGDEKCSFIMAPPHKIGEYLKDHDSTPEEAPNIPAFLQRKANEERLQKSIEEKEILLKEIHHRVKNNLQVVCSLLNLQSNFIEDEDAKSKIGESISRIRSIAVLHELLYGDTDIKHVNPLRYFELVVQEIKVGLLDNSAVQIVTDGDDDGYLMDIDAAMPCGLILHELIINATKYAFRGVNAPRIDISFQRADKCILKVTDNGTGIQPKSVESGLGFELVQALVDQMSGELAIDSSPGRGTEVTLKF